MKKLLSLVLAGAMALSLAACGGGNSGGGGAMGQVGAGASAAGGDELPVVQWKMVSTWGSGNVHFTVDQRFSALVSQLTNGKFQITNYGEGEICSANQVFDSVQEGTVQAGGDWSGYWAGKDPAFELLSTTMNLFSGLDYYVWFEQGDGIDVAQELYGQYDLMWFPILCHFSESGIRSSKPITSIADLQTMKTRLGGVMAGRVGAKLGFNITTVPAAELYESLQRGVIDAGEFSGPNADSTLKLQEVAKYWVEPAWYQSAGNNGVIINKAAWDALPEAYQQAVATAAAACRGEGLARYTWLDSVAASKMIDQEGVTVTYMNEDDLKTIKATAQEVYEAEAAVNPNFKLVYDSMLEYCKVVDPYREMLNSGGYGYGFSHGLN
ncbi:TRAP transporter substrate-binding protein DctP [Oscillibacter sp.]|uniref:TRAP transporter substrate-binding protein n=1 Tax=Oscillibacter sp. TaxID=1945593 RepID=UPI00289F1A67|nr:TRAP transporter substrate-binding protein DctP [Oscillibacter sp.]